MLPKTETYFSNGEQISKVEYVYNGGFLIERHTSILSYEYNKFESFTYSDGKIISLSVTQDGGETLTYPAFLVSDRKYDFHDLNGMLYATFTFDKSGRLIGENYANGYIYEQVYDFNKNGLEKIRKFTRMPSGSSNSSTLISKKIGDNIYLLTDNNDSSVYAEIKFQE